MCRNDICPLFPPSNKNWWNVFWLDSPQLIDYAKKGDTDEKAMKMASFWLTVSICSPARLLEVLACFSEFTHVTSFFPIWLWWHLFRKRTWSQSSSRSLHRGSRLRRAATRGWHASPTDRTWTGRRWPSWSTKATLSHPFILPENRMNSLSSTSCSKVTGRSRQNRYLAQFHQSHDGEISLMLCPERWCHHCLLRRRWWCRFWMNSDMSSSKWAFQFLIARR